MLENYVNYLKVLDEKLNKFFNMQKPYIFCTKGCAKCCKNAEFPFSLIEIKYLLSGFLNLDKETQNIIEDNIKKTCENKKNFKGEKFLYDCPFLINNECSLYQYRGIVCRAFGLMYVGRDDITKAPFCCFEGLNYSNVADYETKIISPKKFESLKLEQEPLAFNVSYKFLTSPNVEKCFNFNFGDKKALIDWFIELDKKINSL